MKLKIVGEKDHARARIYIDDKEITTVYDIRITMEAGGPYRATISFHPSSWEVEGFYDLGGAGKRGR